MSAHREALEKEQALLVLESKNAELRNQLTNLQAPWWRKSGTVTIIAALLAAVLPVSTGVQEYFQKRREVALQLAKQEHEIRMSYLDRLEKPGERMRTLRFVLATTDDAQLKTWAEAEEHIVQDELDVLQTQITAKNDEIQKAKAANQPTQDLEKDRDDLIRAKIGAGMNAGAK